MIKKLVVALALIVHTTTSPAPKINDITPQFITFWEKTKDGTLEEQIALLEEEVVPAFPLLYKEAFDNWHERGICKADGLKKVFESYRPFHEQFKTQSAVIATQLEKGIATLFKAFPDFKADFEVHLAHSLDQFDGGIRDFGTENIYFVIGADRLAEKPLESDHTSFFLHEIFHVYHCLQKHNLQNAPKKTLLWGFLWIEGLATYVSEALNPGASLGDIMIADPALECSPRMAQLWDNLSRDLETSERNLQIILFDVIRASNYPQASRLLSRLPHSQRACKNIFAPTTCTHVV